MQDVAGNNRSGVFGTAGNAARYLMYVPTSTTDALVSYDSAATQQYLDNLINTTDLNKYRGGIAPRNAFNSRWFTRFDLHVSQEIPAFIGRSRVQVFADIENVTNLINRNWGQIREYQFAYVIPAVRVQCLSAPTPNGPLPAGVAATNTTQACNQYRYSAPSSTPTDIVYPRQSLYSIRVGARFSF